MYAGMCRAILKIQCMARMKSLNMGGSRRGTGGPDPLKNDKIIGFLCNTGPDPLKNHKATKPAFNVGSSSARQASETPFNWRFAGGPSGIRTSFPSSTKKKENQIWAPSDKTFWIRTC